MTTNDGQALGFSPSLLLSSVFFSSYYLSHMLEGCRLLGVVGQLVLWAMKRHSKEKEGEQICFAGRKLKRLR